MPAFTSQQLSDLEQIRQLKARYCRFIDTKQWSRLATLFAPGTRFDGFGSAPAGADEKVFIAGISQRLAKVVSVHHCHTPEISFTGADSARGLWQMMDYLLFPPDAPPREAPDAAGFTAYGYYEEEYARIGDDWKFSFLRLTRLRVDPLSNGAAPVRPGFMTPNPEWL
jgi:hypothetical protein